MINRELIRLKVIQLVYAFYQNNEGKTTDIAEKEFLFSLNKGFELYEYLLNILVELKKLAERKDEAMQARSKRLGTTLQGTTPDGRFAANKFLAQLAVNNTLAEYRGKKQEWIEEEPFLKKLYDKFIESETFQFYLNKEDFSYEADREVIRKLYKTYVCDNDDVQDLIEDHSIYWNDDKDIVDSFVLKTIKRFTEASTEEQPLLPAFASEDDKQFAVTLFRTTLEKETEMRTYIKENCKNWEFSRLAFMDVIIAQIALTEILTFPSIPLSVSFNEYLDLAKLYSTPRSASYLNGLIDHIVKKLKAENKLLK